ncbi:hypothetical protein [Ureaplasma urealyticum]|uniref:Uncharacterized protein n=2 Tax=Ureaplasma urealyticum TaxID=2130 RepID=A0AAP9D7F6_UREUR|nr:hypothetical protein [Ureaplasma urealyticum]EEH01416.1 putative membrane protein [Ureaplasma urealyticum serovar 8 str. ATCC 27618]MCF1348990.1 hypothetical protein [Ureaplasma urealyticum]MDU3865008.1 hypothetical protein [Ureaplasma urealyticum]QDI64889.1 hypothetical protein FJM05_01615 [Ureaplasma urealyticum]UIU15364.1 hypothetical protein LLZ88_01615 [Ureaplasma urealyticum]
MLKKQNKNKEQYWLEKHLRQKKGLIVSWSIIFSILVLLSIGFGLILHFFDSTNLSIQLSFIVNVNKYLVDVTKILVYIGFGLIYLPIVFLLGCWITGINGVHESLYYHIFIWAFYFISVILLIITICLSIATHIYY